MTQALRETLAMGRRGASGDSIAHKAQDTVHLIEQGGGGPLRGKPMFARSATCAGYSTPSSRCSAGWTFWQQRRRGVYQGGRGSR
jgi:hypothetical protein